MSTSGTTKRIIQKEISSLIFDHDAYIETLDQLRERLDDTMNGCDPCFEMLIGPSRSGKTKILAAIARDYPPTRTNGVLQIPILFVGVPSGGGTKGLTEAVIEALGLQFNPSASPRALWGQMIRQLKLAKVQVILFDEASHLVEKGSRIVVEAASDWFKELQKDVDNIGIVMSGLPRLKRLIKNGQLRNRMHAPLILAPYRFDVKRQRNTFASCVHGFWEVFESRGYLLTVPFNDMVRQCYILSAGLVGLLERFFVSLANSAPEPSEITMEVCANACQRLNLPGAGHIAPFTENEVTDAQLMGILSDELASVHFMLTRHESIKINESSTDLGGE